MPSFFKRGNITALVLVAAFVLFMGLAGCSDGGSPAGEESTEGVEALSEDIAVEQGPAPDAEAQYDDMLKKSQEELDALRAVYEQQVADLTAALEAAKAAPDQAPADEKAKADLAMKELIEQRMKVLDSLDALRDAAFAKNAVLSKELNSAKNDYDDVVKKDDSNDKVKDEANKMKEELNAKIEAHCTSKLSSWYSSVFSMTYEECVEAEKKKDSCKGGSWMENWTCKNGWGKKNSDTDSWFGTDSLFEKKNSDTDNWFGIKKEKKDPCKSSWYGAVNIVECRNKQDKVIEGVSDAAKDAVTDTVVETTTKSAEDVLSSNNLVMNARELVGYYSTDGAHHMSDVAYMAATVTGKTVEKALELIAANPADMTCHEDRLADLKERNFEANVAALKSRISAVEADNFRMELEIGVLDGAADEDLSGLFGSVTSSSNSAKLFSLEATSLGDFQGNPPATCEGGSVIVSEMNDETAVDEDTTESDGSEAAQVDEETSDAV